MVTSEIGSVPAVTTFEENKLPRAVRDNIIMIRLFLNVHQAGYLRLT